MSAPAPLKVASFLPLVSSGIGLLETMSRERTNRTAIREHYKTQRKAIAVIARNAQRNDALAAESLARIDEAFLSLLQEAAASHDTALLTAVVAGFAQIRGEHLQAAADLRSATLRALAQAPTPRALSSS